MKKLLIFICATSLLAACGGESKTDANTDTVAANDQAVAARQSEVDTGVNNIGTNKAVDEPVAGAGQKGAQLIAGSDCLGCHKEKDKLVGPPYVDVAKKYQDTDKDIEYLAEKIIKGGSGVWGQVPMSPHPSLSKDDAREMVKYILSLN